MTNGWATAYVVCKLPLKVGQLKVKKGVVSSPSTYPYEKEPFKRRPNYRRSPTAAKWLDLGPDCARAQHQRDHVLHVENEMRGFASQRVDPPQASGSGKLTLKAVLCRTGSRKPRHQEGVAKKAVAPTARRQVVQELVVHGLSQRRACQVWPATAMAVGAVQRPSWLRMPRSRPPYRRWWPAIPVGGSGNTTIDYVKMVW